MKNLKLIIHLVIAIQMAIQPLCASIAEAKQNQQSFDAGKTRAATEANFSYDYKELMKDPLIQAFEKADQIPLNLGLSADDPSLDQDPFFLNSQNWTTAPKGRGTNKEIHHDSNFVSIPVPSSKARWNLTAQLDTILSTDEYVFFSAKDTFTEFDSKSQGLSSAGEGVFFISQSELLSGAASKKNVPVYFLPLPETGWRGNQVKAAHFVQNDIITLTNSQGTTLPIAAQDLKEIMRAEKFNLLLALTTTLMRLEKSQIANIKDLDDVKPAPGITAGFGTLFTGIDSKNPDQSLFEVDSRKSQAKILIEKIISFTRNKSSIFSTQLFGELLKPQTAQASGFSLDANLIKRLIRVGVVVSLALTASIVLKYTAFNTYYKEKHAQEEVPKKGLQTVKREVLEIGDVFAHTLTAFSQFAGIWFANGVEFLGDRVFPKLASGNNTLIRKFLDKTVYFVRRSNDKTPVSAKTWFMGAVALGGIDTFFVAIQLYWVVPSLGNAVADHIPSIKSRVDDAFAIGNPQTASINQNEVIRNAAAYITSGASSYSSDLQSQIIERTKTEIRETMVKQGLDPDSPKNSSQFNQMVEASLNSQMQRMGLPSKDKFLFDASTLYWKSMELLGYALPQSMTEKGFTPEQFLASKRPGLLISSTKDAIKNLKNAPKTTQNARAIELLEDALKDMSVLRSFVTAPIQALTSKGGTDNEGFGKRMMTYANYFRVVRQSMMALSFEGDPQDVIEFIPESWKGKGTDTIRLAASSYRDALSSNLEGTKKATTEYQPPKKDSVAQWQEKKAIRLALETYLMQTGKSFNVAVATTSETVVYKALYAKAIAQVVGLYPDYSKNSEMEKLILDKTTESTTQELKRSEVQEYLNKISPEERFQFEANLQAVQFIESYQNYVSNDANVSPISPSQPGRFQKLRQKPMVRKNVFLTRLLRGAESLVPADQLDLGRTAMANRNIPGWYDFKQANVRTYAGALTRATAGYWFSYVVWGINLNASMWTLNLMMAWTIGAPAQTLNRFFVNQGWKPMGKFSMMALFSFVYTWATFWGSIPQQIFAGDFDRVFNFLVHDHPISSLLITSTLVAFAKLKDPIMNKVKKFLNPCDGIMIF